MLKQWLLTFTAVWAEMCYSTEVVKNGLPKNLFDSSNPWIVFPLKNLCSFLLFWIKIQTNVPCLFLIEKGEQSYWGDSCTGGSIYHFHENLILLEDEKIIMNKNQVPPSKGNLTHFFLNFNSPGSKNVWKNYSKYKMLFYYIGFLCRCTCLILFPDPSNWIEKFEI